MKIIHVSLSNNSVIVKVIQSCPTVCNPMEYTVLGIPSSGQNTGVGSLLQEMFPSPGDLPNPGIKPRSPKLQADSLPAEPPGKPKDTGVGSLSLLQQIFPTQEFNQCLLHCRQILYQLPGVMIFTPYCDNVNERCS